MEGVETKVVEFILGKKKRESTTPLVVMKMSRDTTSEGDPPRGAGPLETEGDIRGTRPMERVPLVRKGKKRPLVEILIVYSYGVAMFGWSSTWRKDDMWIPLGYYAQRANFSLQVERAFVTSAPRLVFTDMHTGHSILSNVPEAGRLWKSFSGVKKSWWNHFGLDDPHRFAEHIKKQEMQYCKNKKEFEETCYDQLGFKDISELYEEQPRILIMFATLEQENAPNEQSVSPKKHRVEAPYDAHSSGVLK